MPTLAIAPKPANGAQLNRQSPLARGLILCCPLNEGAGSLVNNAMRMGLPGRIPTPRRAVGRFGSVLDCTNIAANAAYFPADGGSGPADLNIPTGGAVTMSIWINPRTAPAGWYGPMAKRDNGVSPFFAWAMNYNATATFQVYTAGPSGVQTFAYQPPLNRWTHIVGTISAAPTELYINGALFGAAGAGGGVQSIDCAFAIGSSGTSAAGEFFDGLLDMACVWNRRLAAAEVRQLYVEPFGMLSGTRAQYFRAYTSNSPRLDARWKHFWGWD